MVRKRTPSGKSAGRLTALKYRQNNALEHLGN